MLDNQFTVAVKMCKMAFILQNYIHINPHFPAALKDIATK